MSSPDESAAPLKHDQIKALLEGQSDPRMTFGLEMEMGFAIPRNLYFDWLKTNPKIPPYVKPTTYEDLPTRRFDHQIIGQLKHNEEVNAGKRTAIPTYDDDAEARKTSHSTASTQSANLRQNLMFYFLDFLNQKLPVSNTGRKPLKIGNVLWGGSPKTAPTKSWTLVQDDSLGPMRLHFGQRYKPVRSYDAIRKTFRCVGAELVSCVYYFSDLPNVVYPALVELQTELSTKAGPHTAWFRTEEHLHVHFAIEGEKISLEIAQNLCALYGLFEDQIESWLKSCQRDTSWTVGLRKGMKVRKMALAEVATTGDVDLALLPEGRYTPAGYCEGIYGTRNLDELKTFISGYSRGEELDDKVVRDPAGKIWPRLVGVGARGYTAINISLRRANKPTTFEFRHHHGTTNAEEIGYWVAFCGAMLRFAHSLAHAGMTLEDPQENPLDEIGRTFLDVFVEKDIRDVIGMTEAAKIHFSDQVERFENRADNVRDAVERIKIKHRSVRARAGEEIGVFMDAEIDHDQSFIDDVASLHIEPIPAQPLRVPKEQDRMIKGVNNVFNYLIAPLRSPLDRKLTTREEFNKVASEDESGQIAVWLMYDDYIIAEETRRAANRPRSLFSGILKR
ncbi:hypothetical protein VTL71DRAFT_2749 [Oculimacula yallundae]|uniref:Uncharacterized protein n=1 Tax=Oculimacula yallundae TaxID=86028 RepID=A0ABR4CAX9_9HELO